MMAIKGTVSIIQVNLPVMMDVKGTVSIILSEPPRNGTDVLLFQKLIFFQLWFLH